ncbi:MAG: hypothetical protein ACLPY1_24670 [Terracidiphilus sp.]
MGKSGFTRPRSFFALANGWVLPFSVTSLLSLIEFTTRMEGATAWAIAGTAEKDAKMNAKERNKHTERIWVFLDFRATSEAPSPEAAIES